MDLAATLCAPFLTLRRHLLWLGALVLASVVLSLLPPALQLLFRLPPSLETEVLLRLVALLPMELYLVPRLLLRLDAELRNAPENPDAAWEATFERQWLRAAVAKLLLTAAVSLGLSAFLVPGLLLLFVFGWTPLRVLLRGESIGDAARGSLQMARQNWTGMVAVGGFLGLLYFTCVLMLFLVIAVTVPDPTPLDRLLRPVFWMGYCLSALVELALSLALLGLFHHVEGRTDFTSRSKP